MSYQPPLTKLLIASLCAIASAGVTLTAHSETKYSKQYEKCMDAVDLGAMKNSQWASCASTELKIIDSALNSSYKKLQANLDNEQKNALTKSQRAWLKYREERCNFELIGPSAPGGNASHAFCMLEMTLEKTNYFESMQ